MADGTRLIVGRYADVRIKKIPLARDVLLALAHDLHAAGDPATAAHVRDVVYDLMFRSSYRKQVARPRQAIIDAALVTRVLAYCAAHPTRHERDIGRRFGIDGGRVSEMLQGLRTVADPTMSRFRT